jgi:hypothetical protein
MRALWGIAAVLLSTVAAHAEKVAASGHPLILFSASATNPDCTSLGAVVMRVTQPPEHGRVTIRPAGVFPTFPESNVRSACNRRRVPGMLATYTSQRGYTGSDYVAIQVLFPNGRESNVRLPIEVK